MKARVLHGGGGDLRELLLPLLLVRRDLLLQSAVRVLLLHQLQLHIGEMIHYLLVRLLVHLHRVIPLAVPEHPTEPELSKHASLCGFLPRKSSNVGFKKGNRHPSRFLSAQATLTPLINF